jgi:hypothetical protein
MQHYIYKNHELSIPLMLESLHVPLEYVEPINKVQVCKYDFYLIQVLMDI